jgi:exodeoxyribonuclease V gamma subunit
VRAIAMAGTAWPGGALGDAWLGAELGKLRHHADAVRALGAAPCVPPVAAAIEVDVDGEPWRVDAAWADLRPTGLLRHRYATLRAPDLVAAWLEHLALNAAAPAGVEPVTTLIGRDERVGFTPCADARAVLGNLLRLAGRGLCEPIALFPKTAWAYVEGNESRSRALGEWQASARRPHADEADPWVRLAWRGRADPLDAGFADFHAAALAVFAPLRRCMTREAA